MNLLDRLLAKDSFDGALPIDYLQVNQHSLNSLGRIDGFVVENLHGAWQAHRQAKLIGASTTTVPLRFSQLEQMANEQGWTESIDWAHFITEVTTDGPFDFFLTSPALRRINRWDAQLPLGSLHLQKAHPPVAENLGAETVGDFVELARQGVVLSDVKNLGPGKIPVILSSILALGKSIDVLGNIDWIKYAEYRDIRIFPESLENTFLKLKRTFSQIIEDEKDQTKSIIEARFLSPQTERKTLEEVGQKFNITRERVRQIDSSFQSILQAALKESDYSLAEFRFTPFFEETLRQIDQHFQTLDQPVWRLSEWQQALSSHTRVPEVQLTKESHILANLLDFEFQNEVAEDGEQLLWDKRTSRERRDLIFVAKQAAIHVLMRSHTPQTLDEILERIQIEKGVTSDSQSLQQALDIGPSDTLNEDGKYFFESDRVDSISEKAKRYLHGLPEPKPLHYSEIFEHLFPDEKDRPRHTNNFHNDPDLVPIAKSGKWALKEWGLETRTVAKIAQEILNDADGPMTSEALAEKILEVRDFQPSSLQTLLSQNPKLFRRTNEGLWENIPLAASLDS